MRRRPIYEQIGTVLIKYRRSLQSDRRHLLNEFSLVHVARKVVGVGSVGTRAWIALMDAADGVEPLVLQAKGPDGIDRDFYVRQLRDWKFSVPIEVMVPAGLTVYARLCGWTLARAHARSGDRVALAAYLGGSAKFDNAIADFAETYADQNELDYAEFQAAVASGKAEAITEI
jgi:hypothetical protein